MGNSDESVAEFAEQLNQLTTQGLANLTPEQAALLSKALFPETHTNYVHLCGIKRELRPLTVKYARKLHALLVPFTREAGEAANSDKPFDADEALADALMQATNTLAEFYAWEDIPAKIADEDVAIPELQALVVQQQRLQGDNDFLLTPLRVTIQMMQTREILTLQTMSLSLSQSSSVMQPSSSDGDAA